MAAAVASPTPLPTTNYRSLYRRPSNRAPARLNTFHPTSRRVSPVVQGSAGDSSDDEDLAPIKLSAEARAILGEDASSVGSPAKSDPASKQDDGVNIQRRERRSASRAAERLRHVSVSPVGEDGSPAARNVRIHGTRPPLTTVGRDGSFFYRNHARKFDAPQEVRNDAITPAPRLRSVRVSGTRSQTRSPPTSDHSSNKTENDRNVAEARTHSEKVSPAAAIQEEEDADGIAVHPPATITRPRRADDNGLQSTMRVKRVGKMSGTFLNGPVRRGLIRRQSEEDDIPQHEDTAPDEEPKSPQERAPRGPEASPEWLEAEVPYRHGTYEKAVLQERPEPLQHHVSFPASTVVPYADSEQEHGPKKDSPSHAPPRGRKSTPASNGSHPSSKSSNTRIQPIFKMPPLPPLPSAQKENDPPPTFRRDKPSISILGEPPQKTNVNMLASNKHNAKVTPSTQSPQRKPLSVISSNTPNRPPPEPPKMSALDAVTSTAGSTRKQRGQVRINGKLFTRMDTIGRGGSSRVFRVMAENYKIFALKRVNLADADDASIAGYKGEIDLLRKLENVERVVRLFDYEVNDAKGILHMLMEMGESDFNRILSLQLKSEDARLDLSFTRHYWKEMLECVKSVHDFDIVHSDLKPANFLLVQGRLKLIDFGIANAIQDNTVNVHRENQIGTPNYMSPESLVSCHGVGAAGLPTSTGKLLKLGKPSDVWSLGCILYQMTYGLPPFGHIQKQFERIMSIPDPRVEIQFPAVGVGGVAVPSGLVRTLKRCLERDQTLRPTIAELLDDGDPFLNPEGGERVVVTQPVLRQVVVSVLNQVRKGEGVVPDDAMADVWSKQLFERIRGMGVT